MEGTLTPFSSIKVLWDYAYYWGVLCQLVFQQRLGDLALLGELRSELETAQALNRDMQVLFRDWHARANADGSNPAIMLDQGRIDWFHEMNRGLHDALDDAGVRTRLRANVALLQTLAAVIGAHAAADQSAVDVRAADVSDTAPTIGADRAVIGGSMAWPLYGAMPG